MKNLIALITLLCTTLAHADRLQYFYGAGSASPTSKLLTLPTGSSFFVLNTSTGLGESVLLGSKFTVVSGELIPVIGISDVSGLTAALDDKQDANTNLDALALVTPSALGKNALAAPDQAAFQSLIGIDLGALVPTSITLTAGTGITGGGDLTANRSFALSSAAIASLALADTAVQPAALTSYATTSALTSGLATKFNNPVGTTAQYLRGDGTLATFPTNNTAFTNGAGYITGINSGMVTSALGFTPYNATNPSGYISGITSLMVTTALGFTPLAAEVDGNITNEIELPSQTGNSGKRLSTNGTVPSWTFDPARTFNKPSRSLNTAFQISTTQDAVVTYTVDISATISLTAGQTGTVILEYADNSGMTTNVVTVQSTVNGNTGTLTIGLNLTQTATGSLSGVIPAGKYVRIRTVNTSGTPSFTLRDAQEVLLSQTASL